MELETSFLRARTNLYINVRRTKRFLDLWERFLHPVLATNR